MSIASELKDTLAAVMRQSEMDLKSAHAEVCKLQGIDPEKNNWPEWSPQANTLRWFKELRARFEIAA